MNIVEVLGAKTRTELVEKTKAALMGIAYICAVR
jgi:hypothetical protein